jgi:hypothetical protein
MFPSNEMNYCHKSDIIFVVGTTVNLEELSYEILAVVRKKKGTMTKLFNIVVVTVLVSTTYLGQADGVAKYSYHSEDALGPANWANVDVEDNQCGGDTQSPIAIVSRSCDMYANYRFIVSSMRA